VYKGKSGIEKDGANGLRLFKGHDYLCAW